MKITVLTVYEFIPSKEVKPWAERVFKNTVASGFSADQLEDMKKDFLNGETVTASTQGPRGQKATTRWRLEK